MTVAMQPLIINGIQVPDILRELGYTSVERPPGELPHIFLSSEGDPAAGKTHFIGTAPGPVIAVIDFDRGLTGVLDKEEIIDGPYGPKLIMRKTFPMVEFDEDDPIDIGKGQMASRLVATGAQKKFAVDVFNDFKSHMHKILTARTLTGRRQVDTLGVDNGGDPYTLCQAARLGKLAKLGEVQGSAWRLINYEFEQIFKEADDNAVNLIVTHRRKSKYQGNGQKELDGYKGMMNAAQAHFLHHKGLRMNGSIPVVPNELERKIVFIKSRQRPVLDDPKFPQHELPVLMMDEAHWFGGTFEQVAGAVFPNRKREDWFGLTA